MRTNYDFTPLRRSTVGFDPLFDLLENGQSGAVADTYPPFDLEQDGADRYRITIAVAGFGPDEVEITAQQNELIISGRKNEQTNRNYVHRGIAARAFERRFALGDYIQVRNADLRDGLLSIELVREIPEEMKPRKINIGSRSDQVRIDANNENEQQTQAA